MTNAKIARVNLDAQITAAEGSLAGRPHDPAIAGQLLQLLSVRVGAYGTVRDFDRIAELADERRGERPISVDGRLIRAKALVVLHRFEDALAEIAMVPEPQAAEVRASIALATGRPGDAIEHLQQRAKAAPGFATYFGLAIGYAALERFEEADAKWVQAERLYADVSPYPLASLAFQRGRMWSEQAHDPQRGERLYREALELLPDHYLANVHLAELEAPQVAIARLRTSLSADDPEAKSVLSRLLASTGKKDEAKTLEDQATEAYRRLLASHRAAFLDHAAEHLLEIDPKEAFVLAKESLALRPTPRAYGLALEAARTGAEGPVRCELVAEARSLESLELRPLLVELGVACP